MFRRFCTLAVLVVALLVTAAITPAEAQTRPLRFGAGRIGFTYDTNPMYTYAGFNSYYNGGLYPATYYTPINFYPNVPYSPTAYPYTSPVMTTIMPTVTTPTPVYTFYPNTPTLPMVYTTYPTTVTTPVNATNNPTMVTYPVAYTNNPTVVSYPASYSTSATTYSYPSPNYHIDYVTTYNPSTQYFRSSTYSPSGYVSGSTYLPK